MNIEGMDFLLFLNGLFFVLALYFTLSFFQYLKEDDMGGTRQAKRWAVICFALAITSLSFLLYDKI